MSDTILRPHAEKAYALELTTLKALDDKPKPANWQLSPWAIIKYIMGGTLADGTEIEPKYYGNQRIIEIAIATLATDRALLLLGIPGTAKTWLSEHLAAAISADSKLLVQGTSGLGEEALRYSWNYARLLAEGPSDKAIVPSPVMKAMQGGQIARIEELTRIPSDVQDALITILSEKIIPIPELNGEVQALKGFNIVATANDRDKGVHELSSALQRRFNTVVMPLPGHIEEEIKIVSSRVERLGKTLDFPSVAHTDTQLRQLIVIFRELRSGLTMDGRTTLKSPSSTLSPAEAVSVMTHGLSLAAHFGDGVFRAGDLAAGITGAIVKDPSTDKKVWEEYLETVVKQREDWEELYEACKEFL